MKPARVASAIQGQCDCCGSDGNVLQLVARVTNPTRATRLCPDCIDFARRVLDLELEHAKLTSGSGAR